MPTVSIPRDPLFAALGRTFTEDEFQDLCFEFGIELDEVTTEAEMATKTRGGGESGPGEEEVVYKIEVPANRYDILCLEGMSRALAVFTGKARAALCPSALAFLPPPVVPVLTGGDARLLAGASHVCPHRSCRQTLPSAFPHAPAIPGAV